jgi:pyruvate ferredoxin oxidoreductase alpha subunit
MYDGYVISGAIGPLVTLEDEKVREFIGPYKAINPMLDVDHPVTVGPFDGLHGWYFAFIDVGAKHSEDGRLFIDE